ncbi:iron complex outermembrane recepter protein [Nitrosomonas cryotolerans]|uniref:Iron complex outermembrane recepter protein n=1 Tax=Nitrosomonas cryotolerans ATCC 49181 TaxID=1131553 RepID=A0A1N6IVB2_9PROT|nr:TonB-dependent receptor [Nitrosomonas cryotolerans]SFP90654.1 iron complex outermembrane recepter protein [Nitrosomonas cryotolerans]SIO35944.1 iron complex outermembrane recepter protein [Nitrosomonas cryotolerans ATCC 49181]
MNADYNNTNLLILNDLKTINRTHKPPVDFVSSRREYEYYFHSIHLSTIIFIFLVGFVLITFPARAQEPAEPEMTILKPIEVTATRSKKQLTQIPNALTHLGRNTQQNYQPGATLDEFARGTPGVFFQNQFNFAQDLRITIRGFGARTPFGVRGIQIRVDDIPQTLPDGQTQLDSIDPSLIQQMEILRGPSASLFGNASGGMINITTRAAPYTKFELTPRQIFGEFGYFKSEIHASGRGDRFDYGLFGSHLQQNGWREHSKMENRLVQFKLNIQTQTNSNWMLLFRKFHAPQAKDPGGLTHTQALVNPRQAAPGNLLFNAGEAVEQAQLGIRYRKKIATTQTLSIVAHVLHRDFQNRLPFVNGGQVQFDRWVGGLSMQFVNDHILFKKNNRFIIGVDYGIQNDNRQRFNNNFGIQGILTLDQVERVQSIGPFFRNEWKMTPDLDLVLGGRWDWLHYQVLDAFQANNNQSASRTLSQTSGTVGLVYHLADQHQIYTNVASVFEAPTTTELINNPGGSGGFNPNLDAQTSLSQEIGFRGTPAGFQYEAVAFYVHSWDEITPFELPTSPGRSFFQNTGQSRRLGVETRVATPEWHGFSGEIAYTYSDFEFRRFMLNNTNLKGNAFPGIPMHRWVGHLRYAHASGIFGQLQVQRIGKFFVNDINTVINDPYNLGQLLLGWEKKYKGIEGSVFFGINNLFDERYNANTRINAAFDRFFEPGPPINVFGGLRVRIASF